MLIIELSIIIIISYNCHFVNTLCSTMCTVHHITKYYFAEKNSEDCVRNHPHTSQSLFTTSLCHNNTNHHVIASSEFNDLTHGRVYY